MRTSLVGAGLSIPAALTVLLALGAAEELRWAALPLALLAALLGVAASHRALAPSGALQRQRVRPALAVATALALLGGGILLIPDLWWAGGALLLAVPSVTFSVLDGAPGRLWALRAGVGLPTVLVGWFAAFGITAAWLSVPDRLSLAAPFWMEPAVLFAPGMAVGHGIVYLAATLPSGHG